MTPIPELFLQEVIDLDTAFIADIEGMIALELPDSAKSGALRGIRNAKSQSLDVYKKVLLEMQTEYVHKGY